MRQTLRELKGDRMRALDGIIGFIKDVHFDDRGWKVRYLEVDVGQWLPGRRVLIDTRHMAPGAMRDPNGTSVRVELTREEVRNAPEAGRDHVGVQPQSVERIDPASRTMYLRLARDGLGGKTDAH